MEKENVFTSYLPATTATICKKMSLKCNNGSWATIFYYFVVIKWKVLSYFVEAEYKLNKNSIHCFHFSENYNRIRN